MLVPSCQCRGSSAGTGVGSSSTSAQPGGAMAVGCGMTLKWQLLVQPFLATATLYLEEASEVVSGDGCSLSVRWGALWCSHPGSHSVPSRLGPGGSNCVYLSVGGSRPGCSPAGSTSGQGDNPCPAGTGGGTWLPDHPLLQGDRDLATLADAERGRGEGLRVLLQDGGAALLAGTSFSLSSCPIGQQLGPQLPIAPGRVMVTG